MSTETEIAVPGLLEPGFIVRVCAYLYIHVSLWMRFRVCPKAGMEFRREDTCSENIKGSHFFFSQLWLIVVSESIVVCPDKMRFKQAYVLETLANQSPGERQ